MFSVYGKVKTLFFQNEDKKYNNLKHQQEAKNKGMMTFL